MTNRDKVAHVQGARDSVLTMQTIYQLLHATTNKWPESRALVFREQHLSLTWREFKNQVNHLAAGLLSLGLSKGDRLGIWSPNRVEWVITQFATAQIGVILVNINPAYRLSELEYALAQSGCKALITAEKMRTSHYLEMLEKLLPELPSVHTGEARFSKLPDLRIIIQMSDAHRAGMLRFSDVMDMGRTQDAVQTLDECEACLTPHDPINIQFTSGTTGNPKGATLTHHNVVNNAHFVAQAMRLSHVDSLCIPVPLYHCFGMVLSVLACVSSGATMVFPGEVFDPAATLLAVAEEKCTALHGVPTMFIAELSHPNFSQFDLRSLRTGIMAGSPCPIETMKRVVADMNMTEVTIAYGMTETSPVSFQSSTTDPLDKRVTTVGRVQPFLEAKVVDALGHTLDCGETGELWVRGYSVMLGYWGDQEKTNEAIVDGWMRTGDLAVIDAEGYCNIVGRLKDMVIRGGENIYPREIEEFLFKHPKIVSAQVFGVPDAKYGEELAVWIVLAPGQTLSEQEVRAYCKDNIAHYKVPRHICFVTDMPMTITGKVQKFVMRQTMIDKLKLAEIQTA